MPGEGEPQSGREPSPTIHPSWTESASKQSTSASALPSSAKTKYYNPTTMRQAYYVSPELAAVFRARIARTPFIQRRNTTDQ
jgi:hypothetical protein